MKKSQGEATTAKNLEDKFDRGEEVLDYFNVRKARVITSSSKGSADKPKYAHPVKGNSHRRVSFAKNQRVIAKRSRKRALRF